MSRTPILVTGAGGNVGAAVVQHLRACGLAVRAADHPPCRARRQRRTARHRPAGSHWPSHLPAVVRRRPAALPDPTPAIAPVGPTINVCIDAAAAAGVEHIVFSSVGGAECNRIVPTPASRPT